MLQSEWVGQTDYICHRFDLLVSSGYRTGAENDAAGGATNSDHLRGDAVDLVGSRHNVYACHDWADDRFPYVEPMAEARTHCHISFRHGGKGWAPPPGKRRVRGLAHKAFARRLWHWSNVHDLDPVAMSAVGSVEGYSGDFGDHGTSYGPWQLHIGGALPAKWARLGSYQEQTLAWSWSDAGIHYAVRVCAGTGAAGMRGRRAVEHIVRHFESPAAEVLNHEIQAAKDAYTMAMRLPAGPKEWTARSALGPHGTGGTQEGGGENHGLDHPNPGAAGAPWTGFIHAMSRHLPAKRRELARLSNEMRHVVGR